MQAAPPQGTRASPTTPSLETSVVPHSHTLLLTHIHTLCITIGKPSQTGLDNLHASDSIVRLWAVRSLNNCEHHGDHASK